MRKKITLPAIALRVLIGVGFIMYALVMFHYGRARCVESVCGIFFGWVFRAHDELWHTALANSAFRTFPFILPNLAGTHLGGYHYLTGLFIFAIHQLTHIPPLSIYMYLLPFIWFCTYVYLSKGVAQIISKDKIFVLLYLFFNFFAGSFNYIFRYWHYQDLWIQKIPIYHQSPEFLLNMPLALSLLPFLAIIIASSKKNQNKKQMIYISLLTILGIGFKLYGGILMLFYLYMLLFVQFVRKSISLQIVAIRALTYTVVTLLAILIIYRPFAPHSGGAPFVWDPFATSHPFIEDKDYFYMQGMTLARYYLYEHGVGPRLIFIELFTVSIAFIFTFRTRIIGLFSIGTKIVHKNMRDIEVALLVTALVAWLFPIFFVQRGDWFNSTQFVSYSMFILNIFAAQTAFWIWQKRSKFAYLVLALIVILTIHNALDVVNEYALNPSYVYIEKLVINNLKGKNNALVFSNEKVDIYKKK